MPLIDIHCRDTVIAYYGFSYMTNIPGMCILYCIKYNTVWSASSHFVKEYGCAKIEISQRQDYTELFRKTQSLKYRSRLT